MDHHITSQVAYSCDDKSRAQCAAINDAETEFSDNQTILINKNSDEV